MKSYKCLVCQGTVEEKRINYYQEIEGERIIIEHVPSEVCRQCGEIYYAPKTVRLLFEQLDRREKADKTVAIPVYRFSD